MGEGQPGGPARLSYPGMRAPKSLGTVDAPEGREKVGRDDHQSSSFRREMGTEVTGRTGRKTVVAQWRWVTIYDLAWSFERWPITG